MLGLHASRAFCFLLLGTGARVFANSADGADAKSTNLRRLLSNASYSLRSLSADPDFQGCDADEHCSGCLEIDASTDCIQRDVVTKSQQTCDGVKEVICCVFKDDQRCMDDNLFRATVASVLEDVCEMGLPCLGGDPLPPLGDDHETLAPSEDKTEGGEAKGDSGPIAAMDKVELDTGGVDTASGSIGSSFRGLEFIVALSCLLLLTGGVI